MCVRTTQHETIAPLCSRVMSQHQLLGSMHETISASLARQQDDNTELRAHLRDTRQKIQRVEEERDDLMEALERERAMAAHVAAEGVAQAQAHLAAHDQLQAQVLALPHPGLSVRLFSS